jgi:hypothetical protein
MDMVNDLILRHSECVKARVERFPTNTPAGQLTFVLARMVQTKAQDHQFQHVMLLTSALAADPGAVKLFHGNDIQRVVANGLWPVAWGVAHDFRCSNSVRKTILKEVLDLFYHAGRSELLLQTLLDKNTPSEMAYCAIIVLASHGDLDALKEAVKVRDSSISAMARHFVRSLNRAQLEV